MGVLRGHTVPAGQVDPVQGNLVEPVEAKGNEKGADELPVGYPAHLTRQPASRAQVIHENGIRTLKQHVGMGGILELPSDIQELLVEVQGETRNAMEHGWGPLMSIGGEKDSRMFPCLGWLGF